MSRGKLKYYYRHMGIKNKTLLRVFAIVGFFMLIFASIYLLTFNKKIESDNVEYSQQILENLTTRLENYFDEIASIANEANYNYYLQNYLLAEKDNEDGYGNLSGKKSMQNFEMSTKVFNSALNSRTDITSLMIFGKKSLLLHKSIYKFWPVVQSYDTYEWYQKAMESPSASVITGPEKHLFLQGDAQEGISLSRMIRSYEDGSFLGVILIDLNLNKIAEICEAVYSSEKGHICIMNEEGDLVYGPGFETFPKEFVDSLKSEKEKQMISTIDSVEYQVIGQDFNRAGWKILSLTPSDYLKESMYENLGLTLSSMLLLLIVLSVVLNMILTRVVKPIILLKGHMDQADNGNLSERAEIITTDETGALAKSFNKMLGRIENLMDEVVKEQEEKRKYELQALQAQINPHFLYNTLDSIIWMAEAKNPDVVPMTEALAKLFRISLNKGNEYISIKDELEHVKNYLIIQSMRYTDKFTYEITIEEKICHYKTVKLIVQPIVENSIYHGIKKKRGSGKIEIRVFCKEEKVWIQVRDDGIGMSEERCKSILVKDSQFENTSGSGIGVKNVNERIQLFFGKEYGLTFDSRLGEGTCVTIQLPVIEEVPNEENQ